MAFCRKMDNIVRLRDEGIHQLGIGNVAINEFKAHLQVFGPNGGGKIFHRAGVGERIDDKDFVFRVLIINIMGEI